MRLRNTLVAGVLALALAMGFSVTAFADSHEAAAEEEAPPVDSAPPSDTEEGGAEGEGEAAEEEEGS
jgi:hypothetical protein